MFKTVNEQLDDLLNRICIKLQITPTQYTLAEERYKAVSKWISNGDGLFDVIDLDIYPQGSLKIGTTVKPIGRQEFDLDFVCEFKMPWQGINPISLLDTIEHRIKQNKTYEKMYERKNRCIRLNYSGDFHMDILPACPDDLKTLDTKLKVPDRKVNDWKDSNPKGFAQWVEDRSVTIEFLQLIEKAAKVEPLPGLEPSQIKPPLKRAIQLMKRYRDISFYKKTKQAPISIVLTTLATEYYGGEVSVNQALSSVLKQIGNRIIESNGKPFQVLNPTNKQENFSEKWEKDPILYKEFCNFIKDFRERWSNLNQTQGIHNIITLLKEMFGETVTTDALREQTAYLEEVRRAGNLSVVCSSGMILAGKTPDSLAIKRNTFFGE